MNHLNGKLRLFLAAVLLVLLAIPVHASDLEGARSAMEAGMAQEETTIELQDYGLTEKEFLALLDEMRLRNQRPWYEDSLTYYKSVSKDLVTRVEVTYLDPYIYDRKLYQAKLNNILEETVYPGMSQWQIALSIHDYLAVRYAYDEKLEMRDTYDLVVSGTGVCRLCGALSGPFGNGGPGVYPMPERRYEPCLEYGPDQRGVVPCGPDLGRSGVQYHRQSHA